MIHASERGAWRQLEAKLRPFVARRVRSPIDVDDVLQDIFLRMQRGLSGLREDERFGPWVYRVAHSAIVEHHQRSARHPLSDSPACEARQELALDADPAQDEREAECDLARQVAPFVAMLPSPYREALTLTELQGLSHKQAAEMLGVSLTAMKSRVARGRTQLRRALEDCCHIALDARGRVLSCEPREDGRLPSEGASPCAGRCSGR